MFKPFPVKGSRVERVLIDPAYTATGRDFTLFITPYCFATHNNDLRHSPRFPTFDLFLCNTVSLEKKSSWEDKVFMYKSEQIVNGTLHEFVPLTFSSSKHNTL